MEQCSAERGLVETVEARSLKHPPTKAPCVPSLSLGHRSPGLGERATAGSDEGTHYRRAVFTRRQKEETVPFPLYIGNGERSLWGAS